MTCPSGHLFHQQLVSLICWEIWWQRSRLRSHSRRLEILGNCTTQCVHTGASQVTFELVLMKTSEVMQEIMDIEIESLIKSVIQPSNHVLVMTNLSIGVSRVFVPQREADVHRSRTWRRRERSHKGNGKATMSVCWLLIFTEEISKSFYISYMFCNKEVEVIKSCQERMRRHLDRAIAQLAWVLKMK